MEQNDQLVKAVRTLAAGVWCLCAVAIASLALSLWMFFSGPRVIGDFDPGLATTSVSESSFAGADNDFHARPLEEKVNRATVIILVKREAKDGRHKAIVSEVLKKTPGTRFYYDVGDEFETLSHVPAQDCTKCEGRGDVVFLTGNPAQMRTSYSYEADRVGGLGGITLAELRRLAAQSQAGRT